MTTTICTTAGQATIRSDRVAISIPPADLPRVIAELAAVLDCLADAQ